jgi:hypothetical protein
MKVPTNDDRFVNPTWVTEKLYGGPVKICENVEARSTSQLMQMVNWKHPQITTGEPSILNGAKMLYQNPEES